MFGGGGYYAMYVGAKVSEEPAVSIKIPLILKMSSKLLRNIGTYKTKCYN